MYEHNFLAEHKILPGNLDIRKIFSCRTHLNFVNYIKSCSCRTPPKLPGAKHRENTCLVYYDGPERLTLRTYLLCYAHIFLCYACILFVLRTLNICYANIFFCATHLIYFYIPVWTLSQTLAKFCVLFTLPITCHMEWFSFQTLF